MSFFRQMLPLCQSCDARTWSLFCELCFSKLRFAAACVFCGWKTSSIRDEICFGCRMDQRSVENLYASFFYEEGVQKWIKDIKQKSKSEAWLELRAEHLPSPLMVRQFDGICYVPCSSRRPTKPSRDLARRLSKLLGIKRVEDCFFRRPFLLPQHGMSEKERRVFVAKLFSLKSQPQSKSLLLVDDVMTTGASFTHCAKLLAATGCAVTGYVLARRPKASLTNQFRPS